MSRATTIVLLTLAALISNLALAGGPPPPPGWGKPQALPPANGSGGISFRQGDKSVKLPLHKIEITRADTIWVVSLTFVDADQKNRAQIAFGMAAGKTGAVPDAQITGVVFTTEGNGVSRGNVGKTRCNLVLSALTDKTVAGKASCAPMFRLNATEAAPAVSAISFAGRAK
jgi:hypothetical protein